MIENRASAKKTAKPKTTTVAKVKVSAVKVASKSRTLRRNIDPEARRRLVAAEAYFLAERRGFVGGSELEDWVAAERLVDSRLEQKQVA